MLIDANNPAAGYVPYHRIYVDTPQLVTSHIGAEDYAFYVQDSWRPAARLTVSAGIRADWIASHDLLFDIETMSAWNIGPRIGATYSLTANQRHIVRANWGRVYDIPNASYIGTAGSNLAGVREEFDVNLDGSFETVFTTPASSAISTNREIDPDRHQGFTDEWIVGYRVQLPRQLSVDVSYIDRAYKDRPALIEQNGIYDGGVFSGYHDERFNEIYLVTNNRWNWFVYRGLELTATKRAASWQAYSTYTLASQHIDGTWQPNDPASFIQPETFANDAGLGTVRGNSTNSFSGDTAQPHVAEASAADGRHLVGALGAQALDQLLDRSPARRPARSPPTSPAPTRLRSADHPAVERPPRLESAGDDAAVRLRRSRRRSAVDALAEYVESPGRP